MAYKSFGLLKILLIPFLFLMPTGALAAALGETSVHVKFLGVLGSTAKGCEPKGTASQSESGAQLAQYCNQFHQETKEATSAKTAQANASEMDFGMRASELTKAASGAQAQSNDLNEKGAEFAKKSKAETRARYQEQMKRLQAAAQQFQKLREAATQEAEQHRSTAQGLRYDASMCQDASCHQHFESQAQQYDQKAKDLDDYAQQVDRDVERPITTEARNYAAEDGLTGVDMADLAKMSGASAGNSDALQALQAAKGLMGGGEGGGGGGGGGNFANPGVSSISSDTSKFDRTKIDGKSATGTSSASMADPANFFKKNSSGVTAAFGSGSNKISAPTGSASVANLKEMLQAERAARSGSGKTGSDKPGSQKSASPDGALGATEQGKAAASAAGSGAFGGSSFADMSLSIGLDGSSGFDDSMKNLLGLGSDPAPMSEQEQALLASRQLASIGEFAPLPPEVLEADSATLFDRTKDRIKVSLKQGKLLSGLAMKIKK